MTLLIDNTNKLKDIMEFNPQRSYYKFICLVRSKDYKDKELPLTSKEKQEISIKQWCIDSKESLEKHLPDMIKITEMFKCRLYMCLDRKSTMKTLIQMRNQINNYLDPFLGNPVPDCSVKAINKISSSASSVSESSDKGFRRWMYDIDSLSPSLEKYVRDDCGQFYLATFKTKNGYHVVAKREFNGACVISELSDYAFKNGLTKEFLNEQNRPLVELKENAMVLVAMGE
jgi:hypothetical protein